MARKEVTDLIIKEIEHGSTREQVVSNLIFAGFSYQEIQGALNEMAQKGELSQDFLMSDKRIRREGAQGPKVKKIEEETYQEEQGVSVKELISRYKKIFFTVLISLIIVFGGGLMGFYFYSTSTSVVMGRVLSNLSEVYSGSFYVNANIDVNKDNAKGDQIITDLFPEQATLESKGFFEFKTGPTIKYSLELSAKNGYDAGASVLPFWDIGVISSDVPSLYFKLNNLATTTSQNQTLVTQLLPAWVLVDTANSQPLNVVAPQKILSLINDYRQILSSDLTGISGLISDPTLIKSAVNLGSQNIGNSSYYHYQIYFDFDKAGVIVSKLYSSAGINSGWLSDLIKDPWEIWIDKNTLLPYQIVIKNDSPDSSMLFDPRSVTLVLDGLNAPYAINAPAQFSSLAHVLQIIQNSNQ